MSWRAKQYKRKKYREAVSNHHRKPRSRGGGNESRNISELPRSKHCAWHTLFQNWEPNRIAYEINQRYLDPDFEFVVKKREGKT